MGSNLDYRIYKTTDENEIRKAWKSAVESNRYESGNEYSGGVGMLGESITWHNRKVADLNAAIDFISGTHEKWEGAMAVSFHLDSGKTVGTEKQVAKAEEKLNKLKAKHAELGNKARDEFVEAKSKLVGCKVCDSRLNRSMLRGTACLVCGENLLSNTWQSRLSVARAKLDKAQAEFTRLSQPKPGKDIGWVVGGWCAE